MPRPAANRTYIPTTQQGPSATVLGRTVGSLRRKRSESAHRSHAIVEQVIPDLKNGPLANLPSVIWANSAWLVCAAVAFHLTRATTGTIHAQLITVPARLARSARRLVLHVPTSWPWETAWTQLADAARHGPPLAA